MKRLARTLSVLLTLTPFAIAFLRDRKAWILFGRGARRSPEHHVRRAERLKARRALEERLAVSSISGNTPRSS